MAPICFVEGNPRHAFLIFTPWGVHPAEGDTRRQWPCFRRRRPYTGQGLQRICSNPRIPSLPQVAYRVLTLCQDPEVKFADLAATLSGDPAIAAKLLQMANSPFFGVGDPVTSIPSAVLRLGLKVTRASVLAYALAAEMNRYGQDRTHLESIWMESLAGAVSARTLAVKMHPACAEHAFVIGLLQDIGRLAIACAVPDLREEILRRYSDQPGSLIEEIESAVLGVSHPEISARLLAGWGLPDEICCPILHHHPFVEPVPESVQPAHARMIAIARFAAAAARFLASGGRGINPVSLTGVRGSYVRLTAQEVPELLGETLAGVRQLQSLFNHVPEDRSVVEAVYARAGLEIARLAVEVAQEASEREDTQIQSAQRLQQSIDELKDMVDHDALTGLLSRRAVMQKLAACLMGCRERGRGFSVLFIDIDGFKAVNDAAGHAGGDEMLQKLGQTLSEMVRDEDDCGRYGGEEFLLLLTHAALEDALAIAERIRIEVQRRSRCWVDGCPGITLSLGVVHLTPASVITADDLVRKADACMYDAKSNGRNCSRAVSV